jgi:glycosyltransferase involved in cell wall biosynthesis
MKISVLMSIYYKERPEYLIQCMQSIWDDQICKPGEIVLVQDGPLTDALYQVIQKWREKLGTILKVIPLEKNIGLGGALNIGLDNCSNNLIARMDTDDICLSNRFKDQMDYLLSNPNVDVVGSWISEIDEGNNIVKAVVKYPETHKQCLATFKFRNPLVHPAVMFRKSFFDKAGYYTDKPFLNDNALWHQGFMNGCKFANIPHICLHFRRANDFYKRRGGVKRQARLFWYRVSSINPDLHYGIYGNICALAYFMMQTSPSFIKKIIYNNFR